MGVRAWSNMTVDYLYSLFGDRFQYIRGNSTETMTKENMNQLTCDLLSIDGDQSNAYKELAQGRNISSPFAYVIMNDFTSDSPEKIQQWQMAQRERWLETLDEHKDAYLIFNTPNDSYHKGWVLGQFVPDQGNRIMSNSNSSEKKAQSPMAQKQKMVAIMKKPKVKMRLRPP